MIVEEGLRQEMSNHGLQCPPDLEPNRMYRLPGAGKGPKNTAAWVKTFDDGNAVYGDYSTELSEKYIKKRSAPLTKEEIQAKRKAAERRKAERIVEDETKHTIAAKKSKATLESAKGDPAQHPYVIAKGGLPVDTDIKRGDFPQGSYKDPQWKDALLIPLYDGKKKVYTISAINPGGEKRLLKGGKKTGCFHPIGMITGATGVVVLGEGWATVAVVCKVMECPGVVAIDAGNLESVAREIRELAPLADIVIIADDDQKPGTDSNPGKEAAVKAALAVGGKVATPGLGRKADAWDVWNEQGDEGIRAMMAAATVPNAPEVIIKPKSYKELLTEAQTLNEDSDEEVTVLVREAAYLSPVPKRRVLEAIKKATKIPFSVLEDSKKGGQDESEEDEKDHLQLAQDLAKEIGFENVLAIQSYVYLWAKGFWQKMDDRSVKQLVQKYIGDKEVYNDTVGKNTVESVTDLFKTEVFIPDHQFDVGPPECVNTINGELELERDSGKWSLQPHNREHYRTTQIPVEYDSTAAAPRFKKFMEEVFKGDPDAINKILALMEMIGYSLMAHCRHEKFIILVGIGANGKSVLLAVLEALLGYLNVAGVQPSQFDRSFQRAHLHGKLANIVTEIKQGEIIDDASLKGIVSGEPTTVEHKFKDPFVMRPFSTCWFGTNHMPHTRDFSDALFRRALIIEFNQVFKPERGNCDPQLKDKLMEELPGILNIALSAYADALTNGFTMPESCIKARDNWRLEADQVAQFVDDRCTRDSDNLGIGAAKLFNIYKTWADENGIHKQLGIKAFRDRLTRLGFGLKRTNSARLVTGISLKANIEEFIF